MSLLLHHIQRDGNEESGTGSNNHTEVHRVHEFETMTASRQLAANEVQEGKKGQEDGKGDPKFSSILSHCHKDKKDGIPGEGKGEGNTIQHVVEPAPVEEPSPRPGLFSQEMGGFDRIRKKLGNRRKRKTGARLPRAPVLSENQPGREPLHAYTVDETCVLNFRNRKNQVLFVFAVMVFVGLGVGLGLALSRGNSSPPPAPSVATSPTPTTSPPTSPPTPLHDPSAWVQLGLDIDGTHGEDWFGGSVSLSESGNRIAIGASFHDPYGTSQSPVKVFEYQGGKWLQLGGNLFGDGADDYFGYAVSMSGDGRRLAIGARGHDGEKGQVKVLQFKSGMWGLLGSPIVGEAAGDLFGSSVSLSADGNIVAIGARLNDGSNGVDSGHVRVFRLSSGLWEQLGNDLDGEGSGDESGWGVSLSADGLTVVIGAHLNDGWRTNSGHARIYTYESGSWKQVGQDLDGEVGDDRFGWDSVSLSANGKIVAVGGRYSGLLRGHVRVYGYDQAAGDSGEWLQLGDDIEGEASGDSSGISVSLSSDGATVAIGANGNDGNGSNSGHVRVFKFIENGWVQVGDDIDGEAARDESGYSVSLSGDGSRVAIGSPGYDAKGDPNIGRTRVFQWRGV